MDDLLLENFHFSSYGFGSFVCFVGTREALLDRGLITPRTVLPMKRASYRAAIEWIAMNDSAADDTAADDQVEAERNAAYYVSSVLIADLFGVAPERIGADVMRVRRQEAAAQAAE